MTFDAKESSASSGEPVDLFLFTYGSTPNAVSAYTTAEQPVTYAGVVYLPLPIRRENFKATGTLDNSALKISLPFDSDIAILYRIYPPGDIVTLIIRQGHIGDPDSEYLVAWSGRVLSALTTDSTTTFTCEPVSTSMRKAGLRRNYQLGCPHALYGDQCRAIQAAGTISTTVITFTGTTVTLPLVWNTFPVDRYVGGMVEWTVPNGSERRTILAITGGTILRLGGIVRQLSATDAIDVSVGCDHTMVDCLDIHNNINNFGGCPFIPTKNPIKTNPFT